MRFSFGYCKQSRHNFLENRCDDGALTDCGIRCGPVRRAQGILYLLPWIDHERSQVAMSPASLILKAVFFSPVLLSPSGQSQTQGVNRDAGAPAKAATAVLLHHPVIAPFHSKTYVLLDTIDGKGPQAFERKHLKTLLGSFHSRMSAAFDVILRAGPHTLEVTHLHEVLSDIRVRVSFVAEAGHSCRVKPERWRRRWSPTIEDVTMEKSPQPVVVEAKP